MGDDYPGDWTAIKRLGKHLFPSRARRIVSNSAINDCPTIPIFQQPEVDMVERERQAHANPAHARRDLKRGAASRQSIAKWVGEFGFQWVHGSAFAGGAQGLAMDAGTPTIAGN